MDFQLPDNTVAMQLATIIFPVRFSFGSVIFKSFFSDCTDAMLFCDNADLFDASQALRYHRKKVCEYIFLL